MLVFYLILFCSLFIGASFKRSGFFDDFMERKQTDAIKGLFIWMVFLSHILLEIRVVCFPDLYLPAPDDAGFPSLGRGFLGVRESLPFHLVLRGC